VSVERRRCEVEDELADRLAVLARMRTKVRIECHAWWPNDVP
jgi:hypothetical protein